MPLTVPAPLTVRLDPLAAVRQRYRQRKIHEGDRLTFPTAGADGVDLVVAAEVKAGDGDAEHPRLEGKIEVLLDIVNQPVACSDSPYASTVASSIISASLALLSPVGVR
jgi:hypothetical protein